MNYHDIITIELGKRGARPCIHGVAHRRLRRTWMACRRYVSPGGNQRLLDARDMVLSRQSKDAATAAFCDNARLAKMSADDREVAATGYEQTANQSVGTEAELARLYKLERIRFVRGQASRIASCP